MEGDEVNTKPTPPENWDRCHAYNERKRRYCRQAPVPSNDVSSAHQPRYCGNHMHLLDKLISSGNTGSQADDTMNKLKRPREYEPSNVTANTNKKDRGKRIPCPIDPSHLIFESALSKHIKVCPAAKQKQDVATNEYYREGVNVGGFGELSVGDGRMSASTTDDVQRANELALAVLRVFRHLFMNSDEVQGEEISTEQLKQLTRDDIYNALPEVDLSSIEESTGTNTTDSNSTANDEPQQAGRLTSAITKYRIKAGGSRHLHQIASILGHLRQKGLIDRENTQPQRTVLEMGAGRGMLGLVVAGAMGASIKSELESKVKLCLVERTGSRAKAETKIRTAIKDAQRKENTTSKPDNSTTDECLRLDLVEVTRIKCDLAHIHLPTAFPFLTANQTQSDPTSNAVVIAKHLCGAGTDLALKSLRDIAPTGSVNGCVMATCCHGLCTWEDYVGRHCLLELFCESVGRLSNFDETDFNILKRWTSASVLEDTSRNNTEVGDTTDEAKEEHHSNVVEEKGSATHIFEVVSRLGLLCGGSGLGRVCQRVIDYGRCDYIKRQLFSSSRGNGSTSNDDTVSLLHYVQSGITPQNALILATKR
eukprot:g9329.t1 g9329   contig36:346158-347936(+)